VKDVDAGRDVSVHIGDVYQAAAPPSASALHQLPPPPGDFTGRKAELEELTEAIEKGSVTVSGLRGMGGIGKTALALKLADQLRERYHDAQIYLDLKGTSEKPLTTAEAMAHVVRAYRPTAKPPENEAQLAGLYRSVLDGQRALLLMDNAANAAQVAPLAPPASCVLLVTSRQRFALRGWVAKDLSTLAPEEARALLLTIACGPGALAVVCPPLPCHPEYRSDRDEGSPQLTLCPDSRAVVRARDVAAHADEIASLCGYLPLALCAAGGMLAAREDLPPRRYAEQLRDQRQRLERLGQDGVEISVEASFNLSYASLEAESARVFRQLAVFPGSFDAAAEEVVCGDPQHARLSELLRRSLVEYDSAAERYQLHDLTRLFAAARWSDQERGKAERRHTAHYVEVASAAQGLYLKGGDAILEGLRLFDTEWANIRAGQAWAAAHAEQGEEAAKFCSDYPGRTWHLLDLRLHPREHIRWLEAALAAARRSKDRLMEGVHLGNMGIAWEQLGEPRRAIGCHEQALAVDREIGDRQGEGQDLGNLGNAYADLGEPRRAIEYQEKRLAVAREMRDRRGEGHALGSLGLAYADLGEVRRAIEYYEQALAIQREIGDRQAEGSSLGNLGNAYADFGDLRRAIDHYNQKLLISREIGDRHGEGNALGALGAANGRLGAPRRAIEHFEQALAIHVQIGDRRGEGSDLFNTSLALDELGDRPQAIANAEAALKVFVEIEDPNAEKVRRKLAEWGASNGE
jgi:tetratricopeptide (TPR) repeat protein